MDFDTLLTHAHHIASTHNKAVVIYPCAEDAARAMVDWVADLLRAHGAVPTGSGTWELHGLTFQFASARVEPHTWKARLRGCVVVLLCNPSDFGPNWPYIQPVLQAMHDNGEALFIVPTPP